MLWTVEREATITEDLLDPKQVYVLSWLAYLLHKVDPADALPVTPNNSQPNNNKVGQA
jgi:hypothetical protein